jgi:hypothetical protein
MSWRDDLKSYSSDALSIIEIAEKFLENFFGHDAQSAERVLSRFFEIKKGWIDERYIWHQDAWRIATEAQYCVEIGGPAGELTEWMHREGLLNMSEEALDFLREQRHLKKLK